MRKGKRINLFSILFRLARMMFDAQLGVRTAASIGVAGELLSILLGLMAPLLLKFLVDCFAKSDGHETLIIGALLLLAAVSGAGGLTAAIRHRSRIYAVEVLGAQLTRELLLSELPRLAKQGKDNNSGAIFGQIERLPFNLHILIDGIMWEIAPLLLQTALSICVIAIVAPWPFALLIAAMLSLYVLVTVSGSERYECQAIRHNERAAAYTANIADILRNSQRVVFNGNLLRELEAVAALARQRLDEAACGARALMTMSALQSFILIIGLALILGLAAFEVVARRLSVGDFVLLQAFALRLTLPLGSFGFIVRQSGRTLAQIRDIFAIEKGVEDQSQRRTIVQPGPASVDMVGLCFGYADQSTVIRNVTTSVPAGGLTAIVGANGSGKSTLARLMAGLLEPTAGRIFIGHQDIGSISTGQRHEHILYVPQHSRLFMRSLRANGLYPPAIHNELQLLELLQELRFQADGRCRSRFASRRGRAGHFRRSGAEARTCPTGWCGYPGHHFRRDDVRARSWQRGCRHRYPKARTVHKHAHPCHPSPGHRGTGGSYPVPVAGRAAGLGGS